MSYNFYVVSGKKLIDYKPKLGHYKKVFSKIASKNIQIFGLKTFREVKDKFPIEFNKTLYLLIKIIGMSDIDKNNEEYVKQCFNMLSTVEKMVGLLTPREFMTLFPIEKDYDGEKRGTKDYFSCMKYLNEIGLDNPIGERSDYFLMEYWNWDINYYVVNFMCIVSAMDIIQTGRDHMMDFFEENGIHFHTMRKEGNEMVDSETGDRFQIAKPKREMRQLFNVVL